MNKLIKIYLYLVPLIFIQCKSLCDSVIITQKEVSNPIIIRTASNNENRVITAQFPNEIALINNSLVNRDFLTIKYKYNESIPQERKSGFGLSLYKNKDDNLVRKKNNKRTTIAQSKIGLKYVYYTRHFIDSSKATQKEFTSYIKKMLAENKDTLHIGTVAQFKVKHRELFERLTKGDSISIQFLDKKKLGERVTIPVEW